MDKPPLLIFRVFRRRFRGFGKHSFHVLIRLFKEGVKIYVVHQHDSHHCSQSKLHLRFSFCWSSVISRFAISVTQIWILMAWPQSLHLSTCSAQAWNCHSWPRRWTWHRKARSRLLIWRCALWCHPSNDFMYLSPPWLRLISTIFGVKRFFCWQYTGCPKKCVPLPILSICFVTKTKITIWAESICGISPFLFFSKVLLDSDNRK